jgi:hypothetical protein
MDRKQAESLVVGDIVLHVVDGEYGRVLSNSEDKVAIYWHDDIRAEYEYADMCEIQLVERTGGGMKAVAPCPTPPEEALTLSEAWANIVEGTMMHNPNGYETDNEGQLVIYTGIYRWKDGSYHNKAES